MVFVFLPCVFCVTFKGRTEIRKVYKPLILNYINTLNKKILRFKKSEVKGLNPSRFILKMKYKTITTQQYNNLLNRVEILEDNNIRLIKKRTKIKLILGTTCFIIAVIPNGLGIIFYPLSFMFLGLSLFEIKNIYLPELKRKLKNRVRGLK